MSTQEQFDFHVFLSHNSKQKPYVRKLVESLRLRRLTVFFDEDCILPGDDIIRAIEQGLTKSRHIVLVLSGTSLASRWVALEWATSVHRDPDAAQRTILPVLREDCDIPLTLARLKFVDARDEDLDRHVGELVAAIDTTDVPLSTRPTRAAALSVSDTKRPKVRAPGGAIPLDSPLYVDRSSDRELQSLLQGGADVLMLCGPRQVGKTSMMYRALFREAERGVDVVRLDCAALGARTLAEFLGLITRKLKSGVRTKGSPFDFSSVSNDRLAAVDAFTEACSEVTSPAILALDELDYIRCLPDAGDFMYVLRGIFEKNRFDPWDVQDNSVTHSKSQLTLLLSSFLSPYDLVLETTGVSPFNIGQQLRIETFEPGQVEKLFQHLELALSPEELDLVFAFTGGQPYLTHQLGYIAARDSTNVCDIVNDKGKYHERFSLHLRAIENHIRSDPMTRDAFAKFREGTLTPPVTMGEIGRLVDLGIITYKSHSPIMFSNDLYRTVFGRRE